MLCHSLQVDLAHKFLPRYAMMFGARLVRHSYSKEHGCAVCLLHNSLVIILGSSYYMFFCSIINSPSHTRMHTSQHHLQKREQAVKRLLILLVHFTLISLAIAVSFSIALYENRTHREELMDYFRCESTARGNQSCSRSKFERANISVYTLPVLWVLIAAYPLALIVFMAGDPRELGKVYLQKLKMVCARNGSPKLNQTTGPAGTKGESQVTIESQMRGEESNGEKYQHGYVEWSNHVRVDEQDDQAREQDQSYRDNGMQVESGL